MNTTTTPGPARHRRWLLAASMTALAAVTTLATACGSTPGAGSSTGPSRSLGPPTGSPAPTVTAIAQPTGGRAGRQVTVTGTAYWVRQGLPGCAMLDITHAGQHQLVELVGPPATQRKTAAAHGETPATQDVTLTGYVPAGTVSACGDAMTFRVTKVKPVNH